MGYDDYWGGSFWGDSYWGDSYWAEYGTALPPVAPTGVSTGAILRPPFREVPKKKLFNLDTLSLLRRYLEIKLGGKNE